MHNIEIVFSISQESYRSWGSSIHCIGFIVRGSYALICKMSLTTMTLRKFISDFHLVLP